ncbi:MAG: L,D-transpeptidase family protein [Desulfobacterales bacterium]|nr:L,D-transpeptidase family protein [Desulfobacterales bacterium]
MPFLFNCRKLNPLRYAAAPPVAASRSFGLLLLAALLLQMAGPPALLAPAAAAAVDFPTLMQAKVAEAVAGRQMICRGELICGIAELPRFYAQRGYRAAWHDTGGSFAAAETLLEEIKRVGEDGLDPQDYHLRTLQTLLETARSGQVSGTAADPALLVDLDFLLTDAFLLLGSHLRAGRVNPKTLHTEWVVRLDPEVDFTRILQSALESGGIGEALDGLRPIHPEYRALKGALVDYRRLAAAGEWPQLPSSARWEPGDTGEIAELLRGRLIASGDLAPGAGGAGPGHELSEGLRRFQARHGLEADGRMGAQSLKALNVPAAERVRQIELNLERWRWLPADLGPRHIRVDVPRFELSVVEEGEVVMRMRVVVGRDYRRTPVFSSLMDHLVFNPDWTIPPRIAVQDILPKARKDPGYMRREHIRVFDGWGRDAAELDPDAIDWNAVTAADFRYKLRKDPGPKNDLGRVKFMFPNDFNVYLHDTPSRRLFERSMRGFSSGCIRIEKPLELAAYLLQDSPAWPPEAVTAAVDSGRMRTVMLPRRIPVHLIYMTAGVDPEGRAEFRPDIYERDPVLDRALRAKPPRIP